MVTCDAMTSGLLVVCLQFICRKRPNNACWREEKVIKLFVYKMIHYYILNNFFQKLLVLKYVNLVIFLYLNFHKIFYHGPDTIRV